MSFFRVGVHGRHLCHLVEEGGLDRVMHLGLHGVHGLPHLFNGFLVVLAAHVDRSEDVPGRDRHPDDHHDETDAEELAHEELPPLSRVEPDARLHFAGDVRDTLGPSNSPARPMVKRTAASTPPV